MYKHAKSIQNTAHGRTWRHAIIAFGRGRDNAGRERVYRRVFVADTERQARARWEKLPPVHEDAVLFIWYVEAARRGVGALIEEWEDTRRGVNAGADAMRAARHQTRAWGGRKDWRTDTPT